MNYGYNPNFTNPYMRNYGVPTYAQPQYAPQPQQMQQQVTQPQPQQPMQYDMPIQYVGNGTLKEAEAYILFPNQKAIFVDKASDMVYEKVCGNDGQSFITHYKKYEPQAEKQVKETQKEQPTIDLSGYVERKELGQFVSLEEYKQLLARVEQLQKQIIVKNNVGVSKQQ